MGRHWRGMGAYQAGDAARNRGLHPYPRPVSPAIDDGGGSVGDAAWLLTSSTGSLDPCFMDFRGNPSLAPRQCGDLGDAASCWGSARWPRQ